MRNVYRSIIFLLLVVSARAQQIVKGTVYDDGNKPLPFVSVSVRNSSIGVVSDIDGKFEFSLSNSEINAGLQFAYVGYYPKVVGLVGKDLQSLVIHLEEKQNLLSEVTILPGQNPAHRIIHEVTRNRERNNPEKMRSFSYTSYNKMFITSEADATNDSLTMLDTSALDGVQKLLKRQHLFLTESVSERQYLHPGRNNEKVVASRVSGFKQSPFTLLATQMQSFSFYDDLVNLFDVKYLNPVSEGSVKKYSFLMEDTLYQGKDTVFIISFRPKKNKNFNGLKGLLYVNSNTYAIQNVIAEPTDGDKNISVKVQQRYEFISGQQWFPVQLNTDWVYNNINLADGSMSAGSGPIVGGTKMKAISRSYIRNISLNPELKKRNFSEVELSIDKNADRQDEKFWETYRTDSLSAKDKKTYSVIDSIGKKANLDKKAVAFEALLTNQLQWKFLNIDLKDIMRYNEYEGYRLGIGAHTSQRISEVFKTGGYVAYGFRDKAWKYGGDASVRLWKRKELQLKASYKSDVMESAGVQFYENTPPLTNTELLREFSIANMDKVEKYQGELGFRIFKYFKTSFFLNHQERISKIAFSPEAGSSSFPQSSFSINEAGMQVKFIYREKFMQTLRNKISLGSDFPSVYFNLSKGIKQQLFGEQGNFDYLKFDLKVDGKITFKSAGVSAIQFQTGEVLGDVPYTLLYNNKGNNYYKFGTSASNTFETMGMNEFTSSTYAFMFLSHNIGKFLKPGKKFNPQIELVQNIGYGFLRHTSSHYNLAVKSMEKGYFESGLRMLNILKVGITGFGAGIFYRYGPYQFTDWKDNAALKLCISIGL